MNFEEDVVVSQSNEYEVLQLLMADMRDRLTAYPGIHRLTALVLSHATTVSVLAHATKTALLARHYSIK